MVPGAGYFRVPTRLWAFGGAAVAVMAGLGVDAMLTPEVAAFLKRHATRLKLCAAAHLTALGAALVGVSWLTGRFQGQVLVVLLVVLGIVSLVVAHQGGKLPVPALQVGLALALLADLMPLAHAHFTLEDPDTTFLSSSPALDYIASQPGVFRVYSTHKELNYAAAATRGVETLDGALSFQIAHAVEIIKAATGCELEGFATGVPPCLTSEIDQYAYLRSQPNARLLGLLNVKYVVSSFALTDPELMPVFEHEGVTVYTNHAWLPRAFMVGQVEHVPDHAAALAALRRSDPAQVAFVAAPVSLADAAGSPAVAFSAEIVGRRSGYYRLAVNGHGWLVLSETWAPGWQARLNGSPLPLYRTNSALLGVAVPSGPHMLELEYRPLSWQMGSSLWWAGWLVLSGIVLGYGLRAHPPSVPRPRRSVALIGRTKHWRRQQSGEPASGPHAHAWQQREIVTLPGDVEGE
jgi:hypothetical protein